MQNIIVRMHNTVSVGKLFPSRIYSEEIAYFRALFSLATHGGYGNVYRQVT